MKTKTKIIKGWMMLDKDIKFPIVSVFDGEEKIPDIAFNSYEKKQQEKMCKNEFMNCQVKKVEIKIIL